MTVLRIDSSIQGPVSASSELADVAEAEWTAVRPGTAFVRRHLGSSPLPADAWANAVHAGFTPESERTEAQRAAVALARQLTSEVRDADAAILALPLYNYGVSQHVKTWFDLVLAGANSPDERLLDGKPVIVLTTRGGGYSPGAPRHGWDHNTAYLRRVVEDIWGGDLTLVERELTLAAVNPAMESLRDTAELLKKAAHEAATHAGRTLASR